MMPGNTGPALSGEARELLLRQRARIQELQARVEELDRAANEPIAIVGIGCRFPGGGSSPAAFWQILRDGVDTVTEVPRDRFDINAVYSEDPEASGKLYTRYGAFLRDDVAAFDAEFFGISPREAGAMDPQQRLLLEVAWETLEHAGIASDRLARQRFGAFIGCMTQDYASLSTGYGDPERIHAYTGTGTGNCFLAGRLAYAMGFSGPALTVDTACSSSLVALHLAAQALRKGECDAALAGGVNLILSPDVSLFLCRSRALSPDGRCKTFDASADGYGRGEGCGLVLLMTLSRAQAEGYRILAVLEGSAVNHDGASAGLTVPNAKAQEELLNQALTSAGRRSDEVDYLEAHGTGTALGDPLELAAIGAVFHDRAQKPPLIVGSVKANVGHMEAAAGIAAVIKVVLSLEHGAIPPQLHFREPSPHIPWHALPVEIPRVLMAWPEGASPRVAGISSFGLSGTNAHVLIAAPPRPGESARPASDGHHILTLTAHSEPALDELASRLDQHLHDHPELDLGDVCFSANCGRARHAHRLAIVCNDIDTLRRGLARAAIRATAPDLPPKVGLLFSGQGAQRLGMGRELHRRAPVFREIFDRCDAVFRELRGASLREICFDAKDQQLLARTDIAQPALFAFECALAEQWKAFGVEVDAVIGHSVGELAAAAFARVFTLEEGMRLVCERGRLMQAMPPGAMSAFELDEASARTLLRDSRLSLAAVNAPDQVVVAGSLEDVIKFEAVAKGRGNRGKRLNVSYAFHSAFMDPVLDEFEAAVERVNLQAPRLPLFSNLTGKQTGDEMRRSVYWRRQLREPVLFQHGVASLVSDDEPWLLVEVGPGSALCAAATSTLGERARAIASVPRGNGEHAEFLTAAARLFVEGITLDWRALESGARGKVVLPTYPFQRKRYWIADTSRRVHPTSPTPAAPVVTVEWERISGADESVTEARPFLIVGDRQAAAIADRLRAKGHSAIEIGLRDDGSLAERGVLENFSSGTVVHAAGFDTMEDFGRSCRVALGSLLEVGSTLARNERSSDIRLLTVAPGGWDVPGYDVPIHPLSASIHAFLMSFAAEHPQVRCAGLDTSLVPDLDQLCAVLDRQHTETQLALRGNLLFGARLVSSSRQLDSSSYSGAGAWLITGGLGALGRRTALWLAERGARELILVGRKQPSPSAAADIERVMQFGVAVRVEAVDVSRRDEVERLLSELRAAGIELHGVIHAAGVLADRTVSNMRPEDLETVMAGKAAGAQHLFDLLPASVEVFVTYSSIAAVLGAPGQANYAAANAYLDSLAAKRRKQGRHALSVGWGPITDEGMAADPDVARRLLALGLKAMPMEKALACLGSLLQSARQPHAAVTDIDVERLRLTLGPRAETPLFGPWLGTPKQPSNGEAGTIWRKRLEALPPTHRADVLASMIQKEVAEVLGFDSASAIDRNRGLQSLGMDSLSALALRNRLQERLGIAVPATLLFEAPTVETASRHLLELLQDEKATPVAPRITSHSGGEIAVVGSACRFPSASNPEEFWDLLKQGRDAIVEVPKTRWDVNAWYDADPTTPNRSVARAGGFIEAVDEFDAGLFRISPSEARSLDPQQRLLLEVTWEALERAGIAPDSVRNTHTGIFIGIGIGDYAALQLSAAEATLDVHSGTGSGFCFASGRLSHVLGAKGPSLSVDTACSSSLVSVHLACQSLRAGECRVALAGGAHLMLSPNLWVYLSKLGALSPRNRCATFDAEADGYVRGEGVGVVVLKRIEDALADGDEILGVIHGSAVNHDGPSSGLTVPNGTAQADLVRAALSAARISATDLGYVEAHGTGTQLGDPIELRALTAALAGRVPATERVWVGSVKANIGHLEAAAGIASLIKVLEALKHRQIPPQRNFRVPNPHVDWSSLPLRVPTALQPWPGEHPYAGISSFGLSGTNAHLIVGPAPSRPASVPARSEPTGPSANILCLSARSPKALRALALEYARLLNTEPGCDVEALCAAVRARRASLDYRMALLIGHDHDARRIAIQKLESFGAGQDSVETPHGQAAASPPGIVFLYSGQGAQRIGMGRNLYRSEPGFQAVLDRCEKVVRQLRDTSLLDRMFEGSGLDGTLWVQPAVFAFEVAMADLLISRGVRPTALVGHSVGEIAAIVTAGVMSVEDGMRLVCARSSLMDALPRGGAMLAVSASAEAVDALIAESGLGSDVEIAALNAPTQTVCSGEAAAMASLEEWVRARNFRVKRLDVSHAFHSRAMDPMLDAFERSLAGVSLSPPSIPLFSNVTGALVKEEVLTPAYWRRHVREAVRFHDQIASLRQFDAPVDAFVEVGPMPVLLQAVAECLGTTRALLLAGSRGSGVETEDLARTLAHLFVLGVTIKESDDHQPHARMPLPTYPFQRERFWIDADLPRPASTQGAECDPLLGGRLHIAGVEAVFQLDLRKAACDWIEEHRVQEHAVLPAAFYLVAAQRLAEIMAPGAEIEMRDLTVEMPLIRSQADFLQTVVQAAGDGEWTVRFSSGSAAAIAGFREHARLRLARAAFLPSGVPWPAEASAATASGEDIYRMFSERGLAYGPSFQRLTELHSSGGISIGTLQAGDVSGSGLVALLDCALQTTAGGLQQDELSTARVPVDVDRCRIAALTPGEVLSVHARMRSTSASAASRIAEIILLNSCGECVGAIDGVRLEILRDGALEQWLRPETGAPLAYHTEWRVTPEADSESLSGTWILAGGPRDLRLALTDEIHRAGGGVSDIADGNFENKRDLRGVVCLYALDAPETLSADESLQAVLRPAVESVQRLLMTGMRPGRLWLVTAGAHDGHDKYAAIQAAFWGLGNALTWEHPELACMRADIERDAAGEMAVQLVSLLGVHGPENQFRVADGQTYVPRLVPHTGAAGAPSSLNYRLTAPKSGRLDELALVPCDRIAPVASEVEVRVYASGLNFRDVLVALSAYPGNVSVLGGECCGVVTRVGPGVPDTLVGTRVLSLAAGAFCRYITVPENCIVAVPECLSDHQAAGFPIVFLTAWYGLRVVARLQRGERVLIHAAAGGVGQAAIQIARAIGAEVWATASKPKQDGLRAQGIAHVFDSRDVTSVRAIRDASGPRGVDVVLNCLTGEFIDASLELLSANGRFVELGKTDLRDPSEIAKRYPGVRYTAIDLAELDPEFIRSGLAELFGELERGQIAPVAVSPAPLEQAADVFRRMAQGRHTGKISFVHPPARDEILIRADRCYVVTGGLGAIGRLVTERIVREGAGEVVLVSRRAPGRETAELAASLSRGHTRVRYHQGNVADRGELERAIGGDARSLPIGGIFHAAGTLDDGVFSALAWDRFESVLAPKVQGSLNLLSATRRHPVDFVVLFSSAAAVMGGAGQANYAAGNAFMAALAQPGTTITPRVLSVDWGPWADAGMAERAEATLGERWTRLGIRRLAPERALDLLWNALQGSASRLCILDADMATLTSRLGYVPPLLAELVTSPVRAGNTVVKRPHWFAKIASVPEADRAAFLRTWLEGVIREVLGGKLVGVFSPHQPLRDLGMDSLMAIELRNHIEAATNLPLPMSALFEHPSLDDLCRYIASNCEIEPAVTTASKQTRQIAEAPDEPIAIVGAACRFPGNVDTLDALWQLLETSGDAVQETPATRWSLDEWYDPDPQAPGKMYTRWMGALADIDQFDAGFFGISPVEAASLDPQQRLLLEVSWHALDHAGIPARTLAGSSTGVFIGISTHDYGVRHVFSRGARHVDAFSGIGNTSSAAAGRLSYVLGLEGPAMAVDTACSSSLVALHLASRSLRAGETNLALVGGVNLILAPETTVYFCRLGAMARDGRCKAFDDSADGYVRSEGCGVVVLKRLSDALHDGDRVLAVLRGTAINQDGRSNGLTAPNGAAQQAVIRAALTDARLRANEIAYVEAHGTGTALGDAVEIDALRKVFADATRGRDLLIGSVKSNMGHLEAAAGIAGLLKAVLAVERGKIPANVHLQSRNHNVSWDGLDAPQSLITWPEGDGPRRAGISSFGFTGTNAHAVIEQATVTQHQAQELEQSGPLLMPVSARSARALATAAAQMAGRLEAAMTDEVGALCWNAGARRSHLEYRLAAHGDDSETLAAGLREQAAAVPRPALAEVRPVFVFSGQGSQWRGMGRSLLERVPAFAEALGEVDAALGRWLDWSAYDMVRKGDFGEGTPDVVQPLLFAMQVALAKLWGHVGITPAVVIGHSMGEIAAAVTAGALSLDDAAKVIALRARLTAQLSRDSGLLLVSAREEQIEQILSSLPAGVDLAARNSYASVVLSGDRAQIASLGRRCREAGAFSDLVDIGFAAHSHHVEPVLGDLGAGLAGIVLSPPRIPMRSTVTLDSIAGGEGPEYWQANLRHPVQFHEALQAEIALGRNLVIEVSPHPVLLQSIEQDLARSGKLDEVRVLASMNRTRGDDALEFWQALAQAYAAGADLDWTRISGRSYPVVNLPPTPFERRSYWIDAMPYSGGIEGKRGLPGKRLESAGREVLFEGELPMDSGDLAARVLGTLAAVGLEVFPARECEFRELKVLADIDRFPTGSRVQTIVRKHVDGLSVSLCIKTGDKWEKVARGRLAARAFAESTAEAGDETMPACERWERARLRRACVNSGICVASAERVSAAEIGPDFARFDLQLAADDDCVALACELARLAMGERAWSTPAGLEDLALLGRPCAGPATLTVHRTCAASVRLELSAEDSSWAMRLGKATFRRVASPPSPALVADIVTTLGTQLRWHPAPTPRIGSESGRSVWLVQDQGSALARSIVERLESCGRTAMLVPAQASPETWRSYAHAITGGGGHVSVVFTAPLDPASDVAAPGFAAALLDTFLTLDDAGLLARRGFHVLTRGAHDQRPIPEQAGLWGLGRVCSLERPEHWGKLIDLSAGAHVGTLVDSLLSQDDEDQLRIGCRSREALRLEPVREVPSDASYPLQGPLLITGGLGHLGRLIVKWLWKQGIRHVVLTGRRSLKQQSESADWLDRVRRKGAVDVHPVDTADDRAMRALFATYRERGTPIRTAIHLAGEGAPGPLERLTRESFERAMYGKVGGARVLIDCAREERLETVVLFSSAAATWGSAQMGAYALANASLDALAAAHNGNGLRICSVAWGRWPRGGLMSAELENALDGIGLEALAPNAAFAAMRSALAGSLATLTVSSMDWPRFLEVYGARRTRPLLSMISAGALDSGAQASSLVESLCSLPRGEAIASANREVLSSLARLLGLSPDEINPDRGFLDMGLTSLMAVELAKELSRLAGRKLPATLAFEYPTPRQLAAHLIEQFLPAEPDDIPAASLGGLEDFSDDELAERLLNGIRTLKAEVQ